jgi:hypothetical protein
MRTQNCAVFSASPREWPNNDGELAEIYEKSYIETYLFGESNV